MRVRRLKPTTLINLINITEVANVKNVFLISEESFVQTLHADSYDEVNFKLDASTFHNYRENWA